MNKLTEILVGVGAVNWLLVGLFNFDLVQFVFRIDWLITGVYVLVGLAGIIFLVKVLGGSSCKTCSEDKEVEKKETMSENDDMGSQQM
jgi:hypothetical protein